MVERGGFIEGWPTIRRRQAARGPSGSAFLRMGRASWPAWAPLAKSGWGNSCWAHFQYRSGNVGRRSHQAVRVTQDAQKVAQLHANHHAVMYKPTQGICS